MKIITVPHQTLRKQAKAVTSFDKKLFTFVKQLSETLINKSDPPGVGLAAPQVDSAYRIFATYLGKLEADKKSHMRVFINPVVTGHSKEILFGETEDDPRLEGCLSIPGLYGIVPRYRWIEFQFSYLDVNNELYTTEERFTDFHARVMQHEFDHLEGILFTDYSLEYDLPVYRENPKTKKLEEIDKIILEAF